MGGEKYTCTGQQEKQEYSKGAQIGERGSGLSKVTVRDLTRTVSLGLCEDGGNTFL
jgi:hypothetical protein